MYLCDMHTHTIASGHGTTCTIADMAKAAHSKGLTLLGITDHGPGTLGAGRVSYFRSLAHAPKVRCGIRVLYGVEANIMDYEGRLDLEDQVLEGLDYAIASMHHPPLAPGTRAENTRAYILAMQHPAVKLIGHCDQVAYPVDFEELAAAAGEYGVILELNNASLDPQGYRGDTRENDRLLLEACLRHRLPVLLSSDSHGREHVGNFTYAEAFLREMDFPEDLILNHRPQEVEKLLGR